MSSLTPMSEVEDDKISLLSVDMAGDSAGTDGALNTVPKVNHRDPFKRVTSLGYLDVPTQNSFRPSLDTLSGHSIFSADHDPDGRCGRSDRSNSIQYLSSGFQVSPKTWKGTWEAFWKKNKGMTLVFLSQFFGALMSVTTRLLETTDSHGHGMHPLQVRYSTRHVVDSS